MKSAAARGARLKKPASPGAPRSAAAVGAIATNDGGGAAAPATEGGPFGARGSRGDDGGRGGYRVNGTAANVTAPAQKTVAVMTAPVGRVVPATPTAPLKPTASLPTAETLSGSGPRGVGGVFRPWTYGERSVNHLVVVFMSTDAAGGSTVHCSLVSFFIQCRYVHCELYFPNDDVSYTADVSRNCVYATHAKRGLRHGWCMESIRVTPVQYQAALDFCRAVEGAPFAITAYYLFAVGPGCFFDTRHDDTLPRQRQYICARVVCEALQAAEVLPADIDSRQIHTGHVYAAVRQRSVTVVPPPAGRRRPVLAVAPTAAATATAAVAATDGGADGDGDGDDDGAADIMGGSVLSAASSAVGAILSAAAPTLSSGARRATPALAPGRNRVWMKQNRNRTPSPPSASSSSSSSAGTNGAAATTLKTSKGSMPIEIAVSGEAHRYSVLPANVDVVQRSGGGGGGGASLFDVRDADYR